MWMFSRARMSNIFAAMPACERMPRPTIDTLTRSSSSLDLLGARRRRAHCFDEDVLRAREVRRRQREREVRAAVLGRTSG